MYRFHRTAPAAVFTALAAGVLTHPSAGQTQPAKIAFDLSPDGSQIVYSAPDVLAITRNEYSISKQQLRVEATSSSLTAVLTAYVTATGQLIGTLTNVGGGKYQIQTTWPTNPRSITLRSSLGGVVTGAVTAHN